jgi:RNA polymerase sigma factor (sigma-70 family)
VIVLAPTLQTTLIDGLRKGSEEAFRELYNQYASNLYGILLMVVNNENDAENLLQDVFVKIWLNIQSYDVEKGTLYTWMLNICRHVGIDFTRSKAYKKQQKNQSLENFVHNEYTELGQIGPVPLQMDINKALAILPDQSKQLLDLIYFKGFTQQEVAENLNLPLGTVKTRTRAALRDLRNYFNE